MPKNNATESAKGEPIQTGDAPNTTAGLMTDAELAAAGQKSPSLDLSDVLGDDAVAGLPTLEDTDDIDHAAADTDPLTLNARAEAQFQSDTQMVTVRMRRNLIRCKIGDKWWTLKKGEEVLMKRGDADWLMEQGYL